MVYRYFKYCGYDVKYASNFTDVDDKIINAAKVNSISEKELANKYTVAYTDLFGILNIKQLFMPRVSEHIPDIIKYISQLVEKRDKVKEQRE